MNLLKQGFEKAAEMLRGAEAFRDLKDWSMAVAIPIDKQRLEEGEPTEITKGETENTAIPVLELKPSGDKVTRAMRITHILKTRKCLS